MPLFKRTVLELKELGPSFVTLTYGAGGSARDRTIETAGMIRNELGLETAAHLTCLVHTRGEISGILDRLRSLRIDTLVALRGDVPKDRPDLSAGGGDFRHAVDLVEFVKRRGGFDMAVAGYPEGHPESPSKDADVGRLREKVDAGGGWVITQLFFDNRHYFDFVARAREAGIRCPIVPGIMPVTSFAQIQKFTGMCGASLPEEMARTLESIQEDKEAVVRYGIEHAHKQCAELLAAGAPGIHFYTLNRSRSTAVVLSRLPR